MMSLMASLVTTSRMQQSFNILIDIYHEFLLLFYCCVLLEIKLTTITDENYSDVIMSAVASQENIKTPRHWPLWKESIGDRWILITKDQQREKCSIWWRHHEERGSCHTPSWNSNAENVIIWQTVWWPKDIIIRLLFEFDCALEQGSDFNSNDKLSSSGAAKIRTRAS